MEQNLQKHAVFYIKEHIKKQGITQQNLADEILISRQQLSKYFTHRTELTLNMFEQICSALNLLPGEIIMNYPDISDIENVIGSTLIEESQTKQKVDSKYMKKIKELQKRVNELESDKKYLSRALDIVENQFQRKADEVDRLEMEISEINRPNKQTG